MEKQVFAPQKGEKICLKIALNFILLRNDNKITHFKMCQIFIANESRGEQHASKAEGKDTDLGSDRSS